MNKRSGQQVKTDAPELRWAYGVFGLLIVIDLLMGFRIFKRLIQGEGEVSLDGFLFLIAVLALKFWLIWVYVQVRDTLRNYRRLRDMHEQELDFTRQLLDAGTEGMLVFGPEGQVIYANRRAAEILGHPLESLIGRGRMELVEPEDQRGVQAEVEAHWSTSHTYRLRVQDAAGQLRRVRIISSPRWHHGRIVGAFGVLQAED